MTDLTGSYPGQDNITILTLSPLYLLLLTTESSQTISQHLLIRFIGEVQENLITEPPDYNNLSAFVN